MPKSACLSMILGNALGHSLSRSSNSSWSICLTDPCGSCANHERIALAQAIKAAQQRSNELTRIFHVYLHQRIPYWDRLRATSPDWSGRCKLGRPLRLLTPRPHLACFPELRVHLVPPDTHRDRRAGQPQASENSKPIGTSSVHHQNRYECSVRSCVWASGP